MDPKDTKVKPAKPKTIAREEFQSSVGRHLGELRKVHETFARSIQQLTAAHNADAAFSTIEQVNELRLGMSVAQASADELARLLKLRVQTKMKELGV